MNIQDIQLELWIEVGQPSCSSPAAHWPWGYKPRLPFPACKKTENSKPSLVRAGRWFPGIKIETFWLMMTGGWRLAPRWLCGMSLKEDVVKRNFWWYDMVQLEVWWTSMNAVLMEMLGWEI